MFNFFLPSKTKEVLSESELIYGSLQRNRTYSQDILSERDLEVALELEERYRTLLKAKDVEALEKLNSETLKFGKKTFPPSPWDGWRENVEVFVVAAIMALAIRTYFLQPFKIPTGSMEPTLYGIEPVPSTELPPNFLVRGYDLLIKGKTYSHVVTKQGGTVKGLSPGSFTIWFEYTDVHIVNAQGSEEIDRIWIRAYDVAHKLDIIPDRIYQPGDVLANFTTQTGDSVLVDKVTYNFRPPRQGEVFIFKTAGIPKLANERGSNQEGSEDFIKRCIGQAGDLIEIKPPLLYVNGKLASGASSFEKEFKQIDHYPGYTFYPGNDIAGIRQGDTETYYVPADCYWAMGDNSPNSMDSRDWGGVPRQNLMGRGYFVFWPFTSRWGWIK